MYKVVIIDDEPLVREAIKLLGNWDDFSIQIEKEISNGKQALDYLKKNTVDIIITDMRMPIMDGVELLKEINRLNIHSKILVISAYSDFEYTRQAIHSKVVDYILKPVDAQNLNDAIAAAVNELENEAGIGDEIFEGVTNDNIKQIAQYIQLNYTKDISLTELSEKFYLSKEHISRLFKKEFDINIFEYIAHLRIEKAKELLKTTSMGIEEIAYEVGFSSGNYFRKIFKRHENRSPSEYKKAIRSRK